MVCPPAQRLQVFVTGFRNRDKNPYIDLLAHAVEGAGCEVVLANAGSVFLPEYMRRGRAEVIHFQWISGYTVHANLPTSIAGLALFMAQVSILKVMRRRIVWTAHNLHDHSNHYPRLDYALTKFVATMADAIVAHSQSARAALVQRFGPALLQKTHVIPHGHYIDTYPNTISASEARKELGLPADAKVFLMLGGMRGNKNAHRLVEAFQKARSQAENPRSVSRLHSAGDHTHVEAKIPNAHSLRPDGSQRRTHSGSIKAGGVLVLAGAADDPALLLWLEAADPDNTGVRVFPGFVPVPRVQVFMNAADVVVFPYSEVLTSGAVLLAMSFGKACIAPAVGAFTETLDPAGALFFHPDSSEGLVARLREVTALSATELQEMGRKNLARCRGAFSWDKIGAATRQLYAG